MSAVRWWSGIIGLVGMFRFLKLITDNHKRRTKRMPKNAVASWSFVEPHGARKSSAEGHCANSVRFFCLTVLWWRINDIMNREKYEANYKTSTDSLLSSPIVYRNGSHSIVASKNALENRCLDCPAGTHFNDHLEANILPAAHLLLVISYKATMWPLVI